MSDLTTGYGAAPTAVVGMAARFDDALGNPHAFDNRFFGVSPLEAALLDPQQRILLECAQHALEDAGHDPARERGVLGVYAGGGATCHAALLRARAGRIPDFDDRQVRVATGADFLASRVAYKLGLTGPAVTVQAGGLTVLAAVHCAVQALVAGECELALAGAVHVRPSRGTGECAAGGCAVLVLKPLAAAVEDGDRVLAVVRGTAIGGVGAGTAGVADEDRIASAARLVADVTADSVRAIGTGRGSGVTDVVPAMAALVAAVDAVRASGGADRPGDPGAGDGCSRFGVTADGAFGARAHAIVDQPPAVTEDATPGTGDWQLLPLSAKSGSALGAVTARLAGHLRGAPAGRLRDVAWTLQAGRAALPHRSFVVADSAQGAVSELEALVSSGRGARQAAPAAPPVAYCFPGHGVQHVRMAQGLYLTDERFRADVDTWSELVLARQGLDPRIAVNPASERQAEAIGQALALGALAQTAGFVVEYALARAFTRWGIRPAAVAGHSLGAYAAACVAGVFSPADAIGLVAKRTELLGRLPPGAMATVWMTEQELLPLLPGDIDVGVVNAPGQVTVTGPERPVGQFVAELSARGVRTRPLPVPGAGHSSWVTPVLDEFEEYAGTIRMSEPLVPVISDTTGDWAAPERITTPFYWRDHMRHAVRFGSVLDTLDRLPRSVLLEVGPGSSLSSLARRHPGLRHGHTVLQALPHPKDPATDMQVILTSLGELWTAGADIAWPELHGSRRPRRTQLPGYPFERSEFPAPAG